MIKFTSATPHAICEPHGMPIDDPKGVTRSICKQDAPVQGGGTKVCNSEIFGEGTCGRVHLMRPTPFIKQVAYGFHANRRIVIGGNGKPAMSCSAA